MSALTSLLVRDRIVPVSKIEEALQSQVFLGGDIEIILLEMNVVAEDVLSAYRAALFDLLPATREETMKASREALRRVPAELARALGMVPIYFEGRTLVVAAWEPLYEPRLREVEAQLGCELSVRIVNQARLAAALAHHYGFELDPRLRRLSESLRRRNPGVVPYVRPPAPSMRPMVHMSDGVSDSDAPGSSDAESDAQSDADDELVPGADGNGPASQLEQAFAEPVPENDAEVPTGVSIGLARSIHGPVSLERASELLAQATQRDDVLFLLLRYVQQFFDRVCLMSVNKEGVRARMAFGSGIGRDMLEHVFVPGPREGLFADALRERRARVGELGKTPEEHGAAALLRHEPGQRALVVPIELNGRIILIVYLERQKNGLGVEHASVVHGVVPAVVAALRRIILDGKARGSQPGRPSSAFSSRPASSLTPSQPSPELIAAAELPARPASDRPLEGPSKRPSGAPTARPASATATRTSDRPVSISDVPDEESDESSGLSAIDLDAFERLAREATERQQSWTGDEDANDTSDAARMRERIAGVARTAPIPPSYTNPSAHIGGGFRYRGGAGLAEERLTGSETPAVAVLAEPAASAASTPGASDEKIRHRLSLVEPSEVPSVIIDMGESVDSLIESLLQAPPGSEPPQIEELLHAGEGVLPVLMQRFPGPLWFDRHKPHRRRPRGRDVSAVARAIVAFGERAAPYLASLLGGGDPDRTYYALMVAGEIVHADLIDPVARRVLDRDEALRALALEVLRGYSLLPQYDVVVRALCDLAERPGRDPRRQRLAVEALGELRDARALPTLLARMADRDTEVVSATRRALVVLTGQDLGLSARKWEAWAEGWGRAHRVEWLIESLLHNDENVRALAGEELKLLTQQYFGYHPALPRRDREVAQRKYREWWELEGRLAFGR